MLMLIPSHSYSIYHYFDVHGTTEVLSIGLTHIIVQIHERIVAKAGSCGQTSPQEASTERHVWEFEVFLL